MVTDWAPVQELMDDLDWGRKMFVTRLLNVTGALLMLTTFIGRRITRDDLFLRVGYLNAPVMPERILWFRSPLRWWHLGPLIILIFAVAMIAFLFSNLRPNFWQLDPALAVVAVGSSHCRPQCCERGIPIPLRSFRAPSQRAATP